MPVTLPFNNTSKQWKQNEKLGDKIISKYQKTIASAYEFLLFKKYCAFPQGLKAAENAFQTYMK